MKGYFFLFWIVVLVSCRTAEHKSAQVLPDNIILNFLDSTEAAQVIIKDDREHFFDKIGKVDMAIQMKRGLPDSLSRETVVAQYRKFLKTEVTDFTEVEMMFIQDVFIRAYAQIVKLGPDIFPPKIQLIKMHANHYGAGAYYTREDAILIPKDELVDPDPQAFYEVMLHEIFHIYSRYHPEQRKALYERIGFKSTGGTDILQMDQQLKDRVLLNPDGIDYGYAIQLTDGDKVFSAIPLITSNESDYVDNKNDFFSYINFNLYPIQPPFSRLIKVTSKNDGSSRLNLDSLPDFFRQIEKNTTYIIHPDEILADNFVFLIDGQENKPSLQQFSNSGQALIEDMGVILSKK